jgi:hypothetical protein
LCHQVKAFSVGPVVIIALIIRAFKTQEHGNIQQHQHLSIGATNFQIDQDKEHESIMIGVSGKSTSRSCHPLNGTRLAHIQAGKRRVPHPVLS